MQAKEAVEELRAVQRCLDVVMACDRQMPTVVLCAAFGAREKLKTLITKLEEGIDEYTGVDIGRERQREIRDVA